jgi:hypothetical protein
MLQREEYIEQEYFFRMLGERLPENSPLQELMGQIRHELLVTSKLPMAIDFLLAELRHCGEMSGAMKRISHYFTPFQTYIIEAAEDEGGRFDMRVAVDVLRHEAAYRSKNATAPGLFLYQFETLARNRLRYDAGLEAVSRDTMYDDAWREWILTVRRQVGIVDLADMIYVRSWDYIRRRTQPAQPPPKPEKPILFGEKEGRIAWANRQKDPIFLFAALQRHLAYPAAPRNKKIDDALKLVPRLIRRVERLETRIKLMEEESREGGIDITKFYAGDK